MKLRTYMLDLRKREADAIERAQAGPDTEFIDFDRDVLRRDDE